MPALQNFVGFSRRLDPRTGKVYPMVGYFPEGQDVELGQRRLQLLRSAPLYRAVNDLNTLLRESFTPGAVAVASGAEKATPQERAAAFMFGIRSQQYDWRDYEVNLWARYENRLKRRALDMGFARESIYIPATPLLPAMDVEAIQRARAETPPLPAQPAQ